MRVLFIDDREREVERLIALSDIDRDHAVEIFIFTNLDDSFRVASHFRPEIIFVGHGLSAYPLTGSDVIRHLRSRGVRARFIGNSGGGAILFESDDIKLDGAVNRNPGKISEVCGA
jgi:hypothetical protein